jgi:2-polyprenyl-3-methyl-5-hydroxy-6-metoxy-1,4-benzoquinol methylase
MPDELTLETIDATSREVAREFGEKFGVSGEIHDSDFIYWFERFALPPDLKSEASLRYMQGGRATAHIVRDILQSHHVSRQDFQLLDFASGYGRVARFFREVLPDAIVTSSDIHQEAVSFIIEKLGVSAFQSATVPEEFSATRRFDVIFALSFFSHMPKRTWGLWLQKLADTLEPNGLLIFTAHGISMHASLGSPPLDEEGFWFVPQSEQKDLDVAEYGNTLTTFDYVYSQIKRTNLLIEGYRSAGVGVQDLYVLRAPKRIGGE